MLEKSVLVLDFIQPNLANLQPVDALISTVGIILWTTDIYC